MKKVKTNSTENCHFYSREKLLYIAWACFRNEGTQMKEEKILTRFISSLFMTSITCGHPPSDWIERRMRTAGHTWLI